MSPVDNKRVQLIFALHGKEAKEKKTRIERATKFAKTLRRDKVDKARAKAEKLLYDNSRRYAFSEAADLLQNGDAERLKRILDTYVIDICAIIGDNNDVGKAFEITGRTDAFFKEWNSWAKKFNEYFLEGYGVVYTSELTMSKDVFRHTLASLKSCKDVPIGLEWLSDDTITNVIIKCVEMTETLRRNASKVGRRQSKES